MKNIVFLFLLSVKLVGQVGSGNLINGVFELSQIKYFSNLTGGIDSLKTTNGVAAYFIDDAKSNIEPVDYCSVGNVRFNNILLDYSTSQKYYFGNLVSNITLKNWQVQGANGIPAMNFNYCGSLPAFNISQNVIPDTLIKSDTLFFQINNVQNADSVVVTIIDTDDQAAQHIVSLKSPNYSSTYYLPPSIFSSLITSSKGVIKIQLINYSYQMVFGKLYLFKNIFSLAKSNVQIIQGSSNNTATN